MTHQVPDPGGRRGKRLPRNQKLTPLLAGRTIKAAAQDGELLRVTFADGWVMTIKTGGQPASPASLAGHAVKNVLQAGTELDLVFADGTAAAVILAAETSSVLVRDQNGGFQYAD